MHSLLNKLTEWFGRMLGYPTDTFIDYEEHLGEDMRPYLFVEKKDGIE